MKLQATLGLVGTVIAMLVLTGCGSDDDSTPETKKPAEPFEIGRSWLYLGPSDVPHTLAITDTSMVYTAVAGDWSSHWTIKTYDNALNHFQVTFDSGTGTYLPMGTNMSGAYDEGATLLTVQLADGFTAYPPLEGAGTCTGGTTGGALPNCRLYVKQ